MTYKSNNPLSFVAFATFLLPLCLGLSMGAQPGSMGPGLFRRNPPTTDPLSETQPGQQPGRSSSLYITGSVVQEDGSPPPSGAVIEHSCSGVKREAAYVDSNGRFSFHVGARSHVMPDATESMMLKQVFPAHAAALPSLMPSVMDSTSSVTLAGCELRVQLEGYRSSLVRLDQVGSLGSTDVGSIVICPIARVSGTLISATNMLAPKGARKALAEAEKAARNDDLKGAERHLKSAVAAFPRFATAWQLLGLVYGRTGHTREARTAFLRAIEADGNYVDPYIELGRLAHLEQKWLEAAHFTGLALDLDSLASPEAYFMNSLANYNLHRMDLAERSARRALRLDGLHRWPQVRLLLANILEEKKDFAGMAEELRIYLRLAPDAADAALVKDRLRQVEAATAGQPPVNPKRVP